MASGSKFVAIGSGCEGFCRRKKSKAREIANEWIEWMNVFHGFLQSGLSMHLACSHGLEGSFTKCILARKFEREREGEREREREREEPPSP